MYDPNEERDYVDTGGGIVIGMVLGALLYVWHGWGAVIAGIVGALIAIGLRLYDMRNRR